jgi:hypothetical protein
MGANEKQFQVPMQCRAAAVGAVDVEKRTARLVWSTGAAVKRFSWERWQEFWEELSLESKHVRMDRLRNGAPLLNTHNSYSLDAVIGVVESADLAQGEGTATVRFSERGEVDPIFHDVKTGIIRNVSVGYRVYRYLDTGETRDGLPVYRATDWEPMELSLVPIGADAGAGVRSEQQPLYPCHLVNPAETAERKEPSMSGANPAVETAKTPEADSAALAAARQAAIQEERQRAASITALCQRHGLDGRDQEAWIASDLTLDQVRSAVLDKLAERTAKRGAGMPYLDVTQDETVTLRAGVAEAMLSRLDPGVKLTDNGRQYRYLSLLELNRDLLEKRGIKTRTMTRLDIATRGLLSGGDFPNILADVANKRLRQAYEMNPGSYAMWARRAPNAPDFKNINVVALSEAPDLVRKLPGEGVKYGTLNDGKETYQVITVAKALKFTREAIVNDDLGAFDRIVTMFGQSARRYENATVYGILTANAALADGITLFHASHNNSGTGAISVTSLGAGRAAMRKQKGPGENTAALNVVPRYLIAPATQEQLAYQYTSAQFVPAKSSDVNEFRMGGRTALEPVIEPVLDASSTLVWYLAADANQIDTIEYCYLDGSEGVFIDSQMQFGTGDMEVVARLDFGAKAIDFRGLYLSTGA